MLLGELNLNIFLFFILLSSIVINSNTALHLLLTAELLWITLFSASLICGMIYDNHNILSLTFFFLVLSALEFGVGLILALFQNILTRSINLFENDLNFVKFANRFKSNLFATRIKWKI